MFPPKVKQLHLARRWPGNTRVSYLVLPQTLSYATFGTMPSQWDLEKPAGAGPPEPIAPKEARKEQNPTKALATPKRSPPDRFWTLRSNADAITFHYKVTGEGGAGYVDQLQCYGQDESKRTSQHLDVLHSPPL